MQSSLPFESYVYTSLVFINFKDIGIFVLKSEITRNREMDKPCDYMFSGDLPVYKITQGGKNALHDPHSCSSGLSATSVTMVLGKSTEI
jgi:hypothetical protein